MNTQNPPPPSPPVFLRDAGYTTYGKKAGIFKCSCGQEFTADVYAVRYGNTNSCGCFQRRRIAEAKRTHGETGKTTEHTSWKHMRGRCLNPRNKKFPLYGGRGIKIDPAWDSYEQFLKDMGRRPAGTTLERKDVNADYGPNNCVWASQKTQQNNRRNNRRIEHNGQTKTLAEWASSARLTYQQLRKRIARGWAFEKAIAMASSSTSK